GEGPLSDLSFREVRQLKVADKNHPEWGTYPIPTFNEVLRTCKGRVNLYLDFKNASVEKTYEAIQNAGMEKSTVVYINAKEDYAAWRKIAPHMPLMISLPEKMDNLSKLKDYLEEIDSEILDGSYAEYTKEKVDLIHKMKRVVWADVQQRNETPDQWNRAVSTGMDGLQTDHPHDLIAYLKSKGIR
ncbi:MAG TPA: glycerophosphodiester phosphodiesterase family protein, partial [Cyclobacteriaceae bacterium]|nr:glycerophosphodiester phosphodiesterase family protein [Cyclobacteriaceae bacterium]